MSSFSNKSSQVSVDHQSHLEATLAIVAKDEVRHWFVSTVDLQLDKPSLVAATTFTRKQSFVLLSLLLDFLSGPVSALVMHIHLNGRLSLFFNFITRQLADVHA